MWGTHSGEAGNLVSKPLRLDNRNLGANALVDVEVLGQAAIILLDNDARGLLNGLRANATLQVQICTRGKQPAPNLTAVYTDI